MFPLPATLIATPFIIGTFEQVPKFNLNACSSVMSEGGPEACIRSETAARDDLAKQWAQFPAADRARCVQLATLAWRWRGTPANFTRRVSAEMGIIPAN